jgi:hypothetical protein
VTHYYRPRSPAWARCNPRTTATGAVLSRRGLQSRDIGGCWPCFAAANPRQREEMVKHLDAVRQHLQIG